MGSPTKRQRAFVRAYLAGEPPSRAYQLAGYSTKNMTPSSIATEAQRILHSPNVSPIVIEAKRDATRQAAWDRLLAIRRTQAVNDEAYQRIMDGDLSKEVTDAYLRTERRLSDLAGVPDEMRLRGEALDHEVNGLGVGINLHATWAQVREVISSADDTELTEVLDDGTNDV